MYNSGFKESILDGTEQDYIPVKNVGLLKEYSYQKYLPDVLNQGSDPICVPCSISCILNWRLNIIEGVKDDNGICVYDIFNKREGNDAGMTFKDAFNILMNDGVDSNKGVVKINGYAKVPSSLALKFALFANGPCVGVLPVYNSDSADEFWNKKFGRLEGYHAVAIVGYCKEGFIIRNSWGERYGEDGYSLLLEKDFNVFRELWTIL